MSAQNSILVSDNLSASTSPLLLKSNSDTVDANKTLSPDGQMAPGVWRWVDRSGGIPIGEPAYTFQVQRPSNGSKNAKISEKFVYPVLNVTAPTTGSGIQPLPSVAFNLVKTTIWTIPQAADAATKAKFFAMCASLGVYLVSAQDGSPSVDSGAPVFAAVLTGEGVW